MVGGPELLETMRKTLRKVYDEVKFAGYKVMLKKILREAASDY